ncbi:methyl-accepting chemotaxis protein [Kosakonia oryzae]|uniref:Methyl-accepting chemotaxis protein n=1 Tax=Kosakonia oryzae TaxID=497725 RepID=A0AA94H535_9ENTR|nr:methyl-accepting chemotaxis protein [Kosakonia oryzae]ANI81710.1 Tar ligand binding domain-containing protein [Kosakonia oryzae]SFC75945.1 Methyl-accepting chemotaxis protein [Kosakonia oryzae]
MFKELKISTGISIVLGVIVVCIIFVSSYGLSNALTAADNFDATVVANKKIDTLNDALINVNSTVARVNAMMLAVMLQQEIKQEDLVAIDATLADAQKKVSIFGNTPFDDETEKKIGHDIQQSFEAVIATTVNKKGFITNPGNYHGNLLAESRQRIALQDHVSQYVEYANRLLKQYGETSHGHIQKMTIFTVIALVVALLCAFLSRQWLKRTLFRRLEQVKQSFQLIATGNLSEAIDIGAKNEIGEMLIEVEKMRLSLTDTVYGIRNGVKHIYGNAQEIANSNNDLSSRTEEQASALQQTAASMEELKITVRQNADNAHNAKQLAESASSSAQSGGEVMGNLERIMEEITVNSRQIADINSVIDSIANQTNILALNAAVEAARAGEQGRGFAVVAGEVRNLAKRSADAAKEIRQLINTCVANMNTGSQEVQLAGTSMQEIVKSVIQVTDIMAEIASASEEQSTGINQIAQAVNEMDLVTQQNATMVEQAAGTATNVEQHARNLDQIVAEFTVNEHHVSAVARERNKVEIPRVVNSPVIREFTPAQKTEGEWETF